MTQENINWLDQTSADFYGFHGNLHDGLSAVKYYNEKIILRREKYSFFNVSDFPKSQKCNCILSPADADTR